MRIPSDDLAMSINIITQFNTKPGRAKDLIARISKLLPESLEHAGCEEVSIRQNQDLPEEVISAQRWTTRRHYEEYVAWRTKNGVTGEIHELLSCDMQIRYFNDVLTRAAPLAREIPKVATSDAPGG
jgi:quinol monooxygenase YgiN